MAKYGSNGVSDTVRICEEFGCLNTTRDRKPYCLAHVGKHPYAAEIIRTLAAAAAEIEQVRVRGSRAVDLTGLNVAEILLELTNHGTRTFERLARESRIDRLVLDDFLAALNRANKIRFGKSKRGSITARLCANGGSRKKTSPSVRTSA